MPSGQGNVTLGHEYEMAENKTITTKELPERSVPLDYDPEGRKRAYTEAQAHAIWR